MVQTVGYKDDEKGVSEQSLEYSFLILLRLYLHNIIIYCGGFYFAPTGLNVTTSVDSGS
jgi:hypothetical protein